MFLAGYNGLSLEEQDSSMLPTGVGNHDAGFGSSCLFGSYNNKRAQRTRVFARNVRDVRAYARRSDMYLYCACTHVVPSFKRATSLFAHLKKLSLSFHVRHL